MSRPCALFRTLAATIGLAVATTLAVATPGAADAVPASPGTVARHTVTLLTGDVVELHTLSNGDATATIRPPTGGLAPSYASRTVNGQLYLIPATAMPMLAAGKLDQELFNLTALVANGYDDGLSATIPLIVQYEPGVQAAAPPPGSTPRFALPSINATSLQEHKGEAGLFWGSLTGSESTSDGQVNAGAVSPSVQKIWLNRRANATLAESVPQVGAPQAWAAGFDGTGVKVAVLDTGIDATHPDLDGDKVIAARNFSDDTDTTDHLGHGTHVASIVAGTGEGAPTVRKGVAPGASLINAKVLNSFGSGSFDQIIAGLEWAAAQGANVANMSLGVQAPHDGSNDPLIQAVDNLSKSTGMLTVIAAGNLGPGETTITSPGWADEALTVGAVDKKDNLAAFSSRGPRGGDFGIKPDLTAPGADIIAARATGATLGPIVDGNYMQLSGTSMATPHVAGAAAILAQRFPDYNSHQLKNTLISTARTLSGQTVYQQGGGRLDVARAYSQRVYASPGTLNLGFFAFPHTGQQPVSKEVSYTNDTDADVTLSLALNVSGKDSGPAPAGLFSLSQSSVTVPAHDSSSVTVTVDPGAGPLDRFGGYLVASNADTVVHTSVGAYLEPEMYNITVSGISRDGRPAEVISWAELWSLDTGEFTQKFYNKDTHTVVFRVRPGTYNLAGYLATADAGNTFATEVSTVAEPQLEVAGADRTVTLDARAANQIQLSAQKPIAPTTFTLSYHRDLGERNFHSSFTLSPPISRGYAAPSATVTKGGFEFYSKWDMVAPPLLARVTKPFDIPLDPQFMTNSLPVDGKHTLPLVYVGLGKPEDYVGRDVRGKIALISRGELTFFDKIKNATAAGAWAALIFNNRPGLLLAGAGNPGEVSIRGFTIEQAPGRVLTDLLQQGPVSVQVSGTSVSPYLYDLLLPEKQRIPAALSYEVNKNTTAQIATRYRADVAGTLGTDVRHISRPWPTFSVGFVRDVPRPLQRTYLVSANDTRWWHLAWSRAPFDGEFDSVFTQYKPKELLAEDWFGRVSRPGPHAGFDPQVTRTEDAFDMAVFPFSDSGGHYGWATTGDVYRTQLFAGAQLLKETDRPPFGVFPALATPASYRLTMNAKRATAWSTYSTETITTWIFASSRPAAGKDEHPALPQVNFDLALDELNRAADRSDYTFRLSVGHIPGSTGPAFTSTQAWVSFNDGGTWKKIDLQEDNGSFTATVHHPKLENTTGAVSLRVKATDRAGNSIDQTLYGAYGLKLGS